MARYKVTVYEKITEAFDCEIEVEDGLSEEKLEDALGAAVEHERINGDHRRQFLTVDDTDFEFEEIKQ